MPVKLLAFSGSTRAASLNQALLDLAIADARARGAEVTAINLRDFDLPLYDGDLEAAGFPESALRLKALFHAHHGFLIASPEYNGGVSGVLKNAIDWVTRPRPGEAPLGAFRGKIAGLMAVSISPFGGLRGITQLRHILSTIQTVVATEQIMIPFGHNAFDEDRALKEPLPMQLLSAMVGRVIELAERLEPPTA